MLGTKGDAAAAAGVHALDTACSALTACGERWQLVLPWHAWGGECRLTSSTAMAAVSAMHTASKIAGLL